MASLSPPLPPLKAFWWKCSLRFNADVYAFENVFHEFQRTYCNSNECKKKLFSSPWKDSIRAYNERWRQSERWLECGAFSALITLEKRHDKTKALFKLLLGRGALLLIAYAQVSWKPARRLQAVTQLMQAAKDFLRIPLTNGLLFMNLAFVPETDKFQALCAVDVHDIPHWNRT